MYKRHIGPNVIVCCFCVSIFNYQSANYGKTAVKSEPASGIPTGHVHLVHGIAEEAIDREVCICIISSSFGYFHTSVIHSETNKGSESPST